jgi:hypothetical protein
MLGLRGCVLAAPAGGGGAMDFPEGAWLTFQEARVGVLAEGWSNEPPGRAEAWTVSSGHRFLLREPQFPHGDPGGGSRLPSYRTAGWVRGREPAPHQLPPQPHWLPGPGSSRGPNTVTERCLAVGPRHLITGLGAPPALRDPTPRKPDSGPCKPAIWFWGVR